MFDVQRIRERFTTTASALLALLGLVLLNASLTFGNVWPSPRIQWVNALSVELGVCVLLIAAARRRKRPLHRGVLPVLWVILVIGHYIDVTAPGLYGRDFNIYWDSRHLLNVAAMLTQDVPRPTLALAGAGIIFCMAAGYGLSRLCLGWLEAAMASRISCRVLVAAAATVVLLFAGQLFSDRTSTPLPFSNPVTASFAHQARYIAGMVGPGRLTPALDPSPSLRTQLRDLKDADVLLIFVESYGAATYENSEFSRMLAPSRADLEAEIADADRDVVSAYAESPTFGGSSWLAHLSLLSGVEVRDEYANVSLMAQKRETLVTTFAHNGYRTVAMMPGIRQEWPEGAFYGFDVIYNHDLIKYRGPQFGWWSIPDQYTLAKLDTLELDRKPRAPVFVVFPTGTTHAPFGPVAPYQPDWSRILTASPYDKADLERALAATPTLTNLPPSYLHAMSYEYESLAGYIRQHAKDNQVLIVIGDHQPAAAVSGRNASWDVPVHVIASDSRIIDRLLEYGFLKGLYPQRPSLGKMHTLVPALLDAFGSDGRTSSR